jgi:hypothetical protein
MIQQTCGHNFAHMSQYRPQFRPIIYLALFLPRPGSCLPWLLPTPQFTRRRLRTGSAISHSVDKKAFTVLLASGSVKWNTVEALQAKVAYGSVTCELQSSYDLCCHHDRLCGLVARGPGSDSRCYQIFWEVVGLERGPLSLVRITDELLEGKSSGSSLENRD